MVLCFNILECVKNPDSFYDIAKNMFDIELTEADEKKLLEEKDFSSSADPSKKLKEHIFQTNADNYAKFIVHVFKKAFNDYDAKNNNKFPFGRSNNLKVKRGIKKMIEKYGISDHEIVLGSNVSSKDAVRILKSKFTDPEYNKKLSNSKMKEIDEKFKKEEEEEELKQAALSGNFEDENRSPAFLFYVGIMGLIAFMANSQLFAAPPEFNEINVSNLIICLI